MFGGASKTISTLPVLYQWLIRYKSLLVAKVTFNLDTESEDTEQIRTILWCFAWSEMISSLFWFRQLLHIKIK